MKNNEKIVNFNNPYFWRKRGYRDSKQQREFDKNINLVISAIFDLGKERLGKLRAREVLPVSIEQTKGKKFKDFKMSKKEIAYSLMFSQKDIWNKVKERQKLSLKTVRKYIALIEKSDLIKKIGKVYVLNQEMLMKKK